MAAIVLQNAIGILAERTDNKALNALLPCDLEDPFQQRSPNVSISEIDILDLNSCTSTLEGLISAWMSVWVCVSASRLDISAIMVADAASTRGTPGTLKEHLLKIANTYPW